jgi:hypothetical protein
MSPVGLRSERGCAGDAKQKLKKYRPDFSSERAPHTNKPEAVKERMGTIVHGSPGQTGRLTVGRNVTFTVT